MIWKCCAQAAQWFSLGLPVSSTNKTDRHDIAEILLKNALTTIKPNQTKPKSSLDCIANPKRFEILWVWQHFYIYSNVPPPPPQPSCAVDSLQVGCMDFVTTGIDQSAVEIFIKTRDWYTDHCWEKQALKILQIYGNFMGNVSECLTYYLKILILVRFQLKPTWSEFFIEM